MILSQKMPLIIFLLFCIINCLFWVPNHKKQSSWANVPPIPSMETSKLFTLGDGQFAYRIYTIMLQNIGSTGGRGVALKQYDYAKLKDWFFLADNLDNQSDAMPMLAAQYFGAVDDKEKLNEIYDYLAVVGARPTGEKWRWLAHAVFIARHVAKDNEKALELAYILADNKNPKLADWAKQMPAFILQDQGQADLSYNIMINILISNIETLHPNEINFMRDYICNTLLPELPETAPPHFCLGK